MDPGVCLVHPSKKPVGVCHLCLRDRLVRLSLSGDSSSSHTLLPNSSSSRSSFDSSCSKTDESNSNVKCGNGSVVGKLGTIFSLIESDSEEVVARIEEKDEDEDDEGEEEVEQRVPSSLPRSKSLSQWQQQQHPPRRSTSIKDPPFARFAAADSRNRGHIDEGVVANGYCDGLSSSRSCKNAGSYYSPLASASATPVPHQVERDHRHRDQDRGGRHHAQHSKGGLSWISSLFGLRKRKKKSTQNGAVETNFFPPEGWSDDHSHFTRADRDRLWRSRSVSSGRVIKKSFTPLVDASSAHDLPVTGFEPPFDPPRLSTATAGIEPRVASLIALDMREATKVINNAAYDVEDREKAYVAAPRSSVASLMDIDRKYGAATCASPTVLQRSRSTGGWRRMIRGESPSSVLTNPTAAGNGNAHGNGNDWGFYLTPLRTFNKSRGSKYGR